MKLLDVVALSQDLPEHGLVKGQVGTIIENLAPGVFEVEFADAGGVPYAMPGIEEDSLIVLTHERVA